MPTLARWLRACRLRPERGQCKAFDLNTEPTYCVDINPATARRLAASRANDPVAPPPATANLAAIAAV